MRNPAESRRHGWNILVAEAGGEDDPVSLRRGLQRHGHRVRAVTTGAAVLREHQGADILLLDLELPDIDGLELCRDIRSVNDVPLLVVTARDSELDRVLALQAGADDYLTKPCVFSELIARMEAVMRRARPRLYTTALLTHGPLTIDATTRTVLLGEREVPVTRKEFDLLRLLAAHPGTVVPRRRILRQVWDEHGAVRSRTLDTHVNSLRNKLGSRNWISTVRGVGFCFQLPQDGTAAAQEQPPGVFGAPRTAPTGF
ncbi:response regulator transcription factor [Streptomyces sp. YIM 98790]|uniref:response regulator transcription factor n=1 Tax=Streptomyces sp. YIM 98790 TaxID=2689077 RepID=UPI00140C658B|nr:response regulator transcription factor [Streptomyces sp. YIM 98790]